MLRPSAACGLMTMILLLSGCTNTKISALPADHPLEAQFQWLANTQVNGEKQPIPSCLDRSPDYAHQFAETTQVSELFPRNQLRILAPNAKCWLVIQPQVQPRTAGDLPPNDDLQYFKPHPGNGTGLQVKPGHRYKVDLPHKEFGVSWYDDDRQIIDLNGDGGGSLTKHFNHMKNDTSQPWFMLNASVNNNRKKYQSAQEIFGFDASGELTFFVNDASADSYYDNNQGRVLVVIQRII